ncbi:metallophosphoesterase [Pseudotabrizicola algicola]|uniref:Serine/threonine protein phosphatase n=1 Tax=Pseudotabrizicola algicola TaxID=2709381 RepID=A0A6B3RQD8_9RHOB|nr:metallophosphoesterase [Pseudotabrizicola algicola]NEX45329.1 serine/threonine protein phosphatase [Pseudotabrizicola algicola]
MTVLGRLLRGFGQRKAQDSAHPTAEVLVLDPFDGPVYAVGDVHGCLPLYREVEDAILRDAEQFEQPPTLVLLGDVIDRGPHSAAMLDHLLRPLPAPARRLCLLGNHESMMLAFLASPRANLRWLRFGGHETLASYGMTFDVDELEAMPERRLVQTIAAHVPEAHLRLLRSLLPALQVGPYLLAHAGADASAPLTAQPLQSLIWGSAGLVAPSGLTLIHGHYITAEPEVRSTSIGIDTGAYATGRLTALRLLDGQKPAFMSTSSDDLTNNLAVFA